MLKVLDKLTVIFGYMLTFSVTFFILFFISSFLIKNNNFFINISLCIISLVTSIKYTKVKSPYI